jgi:branched-chain amino acid transport system substrate-binding protein
MVVWGAPNVLATAIHSISDSGLDIPTLVGDSIMVYSVMNDLNGFLPKQLYFASGGWAGISALKAGAQRTNLVNTIALMNAANISPDAGSTEPWDAGAIVVDVLRKLGPDASASAIRAAIANLHDYDGIMGPYDFRSGDQRGLNANDVMIYRWLNDAREWRPVSLGGGAPLPSR